MYMNTFSTSLFLKAMYLSFLLLYATWIQDYKEYCIYKLYYQALYQATILILMVMESLAAGDRCGYYC
jgi:hypothetical protein